ncbi:tyrosine-type recombinase/integrase [Halorubrum sp. JWXQ-INN 858]|uniref:tyrosine-type recombinase/integrase n=1 Tax=Halorubrum sp. JWXQ-INN 858 TaxID=2690782 RepID=UPI00135991F7|nr:tyrosine-type recombinase/integrase [Halorubrum sp. JWXQ-INN 858]MWV65933.1 tyrosine-type recombinase/integrase [Halorubrum sp. JWXQ-INN 858]
MTDTPVTPEEAVEEYLKSRHDVTNSTLSNHQYRLGIFTEWAQSNGINDVSEIGGFDIQQYQNWRHSDDAPDCAPITLQQHAHTLRVWLRWCERAELVDDGLAERVPIQSVTSDERSRDDTVSHERATQILEWLESYHYASVKHIIFATLYHCGLRRSALHALDVEDWHSDEGYLSIRNREDEGTRIKLGAEGERHITVSDTQLSQALDDWVADVRPDVTDEYGREPLISTKNGRAHPTTLAKHCYSITRPCEVTGECPHDRVVDECKATSSKHASKCPSSRSPHSLRRAAVTHFLDSGIDKSIVSSRMSVSPKVMSEHYDVRSEEQRRENRKRHLDKLD